GAVSVSMGWGRAVPDRHGLELCGVGMLRVWQQPGDDDVVAVPPWSRIASFAAEPPRNRHADGAHAGDFQSRQGQSFGQLGDRAGEIDIVTKPAERYFHE